MSRPCSSWVSRVAPAAAVLVASCLLALGLAACSGSGPANTDSSARSSTPPLPLLSVPPAPTTLPTYSQYPVPASVRDDAAKRKQVQIDSCTTSGTAAKAVGTVHNTDQRSADYEITVFFTSNTATAVNYATTSVTVAGGSTAGFTAAREFAAPDQLLCVLVGVS